MSALGPLEVRTVELEPRRLAFFRSVSTYTDALYLVVAFRDDGMHAVVWCPERKRVLFDGRPDLTRELEA